MDLVQVTFTVWRTYEWFIGRPTEQQRRRKHPSGVTILLKVSHFTVTFTGHREPSSPHPFSVTWRIHKEYGKTWPKSQMYKVFGSVFIPPWERFRVVYHSLTSLCVHRDSVTLKYRTHMSILSDRTIYNFTYLVQYSSYIVQNILDSKFYKNFVSTFGLLSRLALRHLSVPNSHLRYFPVTPSSTLWR